jgi:fatty-acyl-CoA synthase
MNAQDPWALITKRLTPNSSIPAITTAHGVLTYGQLRRASAALSARLADDFRPQTSVSVLLGMLPEYLVADISILQSNLVKVPLNPMLSGAEMAFIIEHSQSTALLTSSKLSPADIDKIAEIRRTLPNLGVLDIDLIELLSDEAPRLHQPAPATATDAAAIYYTGGTTGHPKGVVHSRSGVAATIVAHALEADIGSDDTLLLSTSLSHSAGAFAAAGLARGSHLVLLDKFTPEEFCEAASTYSATWAMAVPTMLYRILDHLDARPDQTPSLRTFVYGSAPIAPSQLLRALHRFGPIFIQLFGQSECPNWGTSLTKQDHARAMIEVAILSSCGRPCLMADVRVVDDEGRDLPPGGVGEILLAAPYAMKEYWNNVNATRATLIDGWVHTRDVGKFDEDGFLFILDRTSDMIITGGYNVYSSEVEAELHRIDGVAQAAVVGVPDDEWGEAVCAFVVVAPGNLLDADEIMRRSRELLGSYKRPKRIVLTDVIPLTPFGKADKKALRAPYWEGRTRAV